MQFTHVTKPSFTVIGKEGSTKDGPGFIQRLWAQANSGYPQIAPLVKTDENGTPAGFWGLMTDFSRSFEPWEDDFTQGLYLAGAEAAEDAAPPEGWAKWTVPAYKYLRVKVEGDPATAQTFAAALQYIKQNGLTLAGAVHDHNAPSENGQPYMYFPIQKL